MDPTFVDPFQHYLVNPPEVVERTKQILDSEEWNHPIRIEDARMEDYDAIVIVGGPGAALDLVGNPNVHELLVKAFTSGKLMGALCYAVAAFIWARNPATGKSIIYGRKVAAHPMEWDFKADMAYDLYGEVEGNRGTDLITPGFVFPLQVIVEDAVGPDGYVDSDETANRERPVVHVDGPFVTALSVESSIAFGSKIVEILAVREPGAVAR
jgi:putative intracellular protease/amidase